MQDSALYTCCLRGKETKLPCRADRRWRRSKEGTEGLNSGNCQDGSACNQTGEVGNIFWALREKAYFSLARRGISRRTIAKYVRNSAPFLLGLAAACLRLDLRFRKPENIDTMLLLRKLYTVQGKPVPSDLVARIESHLPQIDEVLSTVEQGRANQQAVMMAVKRCQHQGRAVPLPLEKYALEFHGADLADGSQRLDRFRRFCYLRLMLRESVSEADLLSAFPYYPGLDTTYAFLAPLYQDANDRGEAGHLDLPTRILHDRFPSCPACLYFRASWLFYFGDADCALELLKESESICEAHDYLAKLYVTVLNHKKQREQGKQFIRRFFRTYSGDLWRTPGFSYRQRKAIRRSLPPILIVTLPKSGSVFLLNTLSQGLNVPHTYVTPMGLYSDVVIEERARDLARGGAISVDHPQATDEILDTLHRSGLRKILFHYRDIRQSTLSFVHHLCSDEVRFAAPRERFNAQREGIANGSAFEANYRQMFLRHLPFLEGWGRRIDEDDRFEFMVTNFDDLGDEEQLIKNILDFYEIDHRKFDWTVLKSDKEKRAGHFRKGLKDEWREILSSDTQNWIDGEMVKMPALEKLDHLRQAAKMKCGAKGYSA